MNGDAGAGCCFGAMCAAVLAMVFIPSCGGCRNTPPPNCKEYEARQIGVLDVAERRWTPRLYVVSIEGCKYYATESSGPYVILGPEVPAEAWAAIQKRTKSDYEFIDLEEVPND